MAQKVPLESRIARALKDEKSGSDQLRELIRDVTTARRELDQQRTDLRERALDPIAQVDDVARSRSALADADFDMQRLDAALDRLRSALGEAEEREEGARRKQEYDSARRERDQLAKALHETYPRAAQEIADLLARIKRSDERIAAVNRARPDGAAHIDAVEFCVRGVDEAGQAHSGANSFPLQVGRLVEKVMLPALSGIDAAKKQDFWNPRTSFLTG